MDFITANIKSLYRKYLIASMASALVMSVYSFVDTIAVGQSEGPLGAAAMAVITPLYGILVFLGILCGIGGSVLTSNAWGEGKKEKGNAYFTAAVVLMATLTAVTWIAFALFHHEIFTFFGADEHTMPKVMEYAKWLIATVPIFIAPTFISAFIRNDGAPGLAMAAVIIGGCINVFGDWFLVFPLGMGMTGAAIYTKAKNDIGATPGQKVVVESSTKKLLGVVTLVYVLPVILFLLGYFLSEGLSESVRYVIAIVSAAVSLIPVVLYDRYARRNDTLTYNIVRLF